MHHNRSWIVICTMAAGLGAGACQSGDADDQDELQALLRDEPLEQVPPGAVEASPRVPAPIAPGASSGPPVGRWTFDDCSPFRTQLNDAAFGNAAFRAVNAACTAGVQGQGVAIAQTEDIVYVPDEPTFTFESGATVAGWFKPTTISGTRTLIRKRDKGTSSFALVLTGGKFQFVASFGNGRAASVTAPSKARVGVFQHVAASYDGQTMRLYVDGNRVSSFDVSGTIPLGAGPLLIGNDGSERRFNGTVDTVVFATHALTDDEVLQLTCLAQLPSVSVTDAPPPLQPGGSTTLDVALTNHNPPGACAPITFSITAFADNLLLDPPPSTPASSAPVASGQTGHFLITVTAPQSAEPSDVDLVMFIQEQTTSFFDFKRVPFTVVASTGCQVIPSRELMIRDISVVDDPVRTRFSARSTDPANGAWTFKRLMEDMAPSAADAPAMVEAMLASFVTPQTINGFTVGPRPVMSGLIDHWPRTGDGKLDLARAPLKLQAIVNRFDLRNLAAGDAGEGRFVFAFYSDSGFPLSATMILEYKLPATTDEDVLGWAQAFHALGALEFGDDYNAALQAITDRFATRGTRPGHINGSAINSVRTNEIDFGDVFLWQLREFDLSPATGLLVPVPLELTPDRSFDGTDTLASYINANQAAILGDAHVVPTVFDGQPFQAGAVFNDLTTWFAPGVDPEARHHFALNTCNGCHAQQETGVVFLQIEPRTVGTRAGLSPFLTGSTVSDPVTGQVRTFDDLGRRKLDLQAIVCPGSSAPAGTSLRRGIRRVH